MLCDPFVFRSCPECGEEAVLTCWRCDGAGLLKAEDRDEGPFVVVHRCEERPRLFVGRLEVL